MGYTPRHRSPVERLVAVALDSLAVEVAVAALVHAPAHPALHYGDLVHLGGGEAGVEALLAGDRAEAGGPGAARPALDCYSLLQAPLPVMDHYTAGHDTRHIENVKLFSNIYFLQLPFWGC